MNPQNTKVKICGISEPEHASIAVETGADYVGLNFYPSSHRYITPEQAVQVARATRASAGQRDVKIVGLFVNEPVERIRQIVDLVGLDIVQLSGNEEPSMLAELPVPAIGTVRASRQDQDSARIAFERWIWANPQPYAVIIDSHVPGAYGGTGEVGDWDLAQHLSRQFPTFLAGGLNEENVRAAIDTVAPYAVDVSSGVETDRRKDPQKIRAFISAVRTVQKAVRERA